MGLAITKDVIFEWQMFLLFDINGFNDLKIDVIFLTRIIISLLLKNPNIVLNRLKYVQLNDLT